MQSVVARSFAGKNTVSEAKDVVLDRLRALANAHSLLTRKDWIGAELAEVIRTEMSAYKERVTISGPPVFLNVRAGQNFVLAVHELATNAAKYGALSNVTGAVDIRWTLDESAGTLEFRWLERGGPPVEAPRGKGFGSVVLEHVMSEHSEGKPEIEFRPSGVAYAVTCSLEAVRADSHRAA